MSDKLPSTYFLPADEEAYHILKMVVKGYERFRHIDVDKVSLIFKVANKNRFAAEVRKISKVYSVFIPNKELLITIFRPQWESMNTPTKVAVMYHELVHVGFDEESGEYKLIRHDVEDFRELIEKLGFNYEKAIDLFKEMKPEVAAEVSRGA